MRNKLIEAVENKVIRNDLPELKVGSNVKVHVRIKEGNKERIQRFKGSNGQRATRLSWV